MSIINEALKKASNKNRSYLSDIVAETSKEANRVFHLDTQRSVRKKKWVVLGGISGTLAAGIAVFTLFLGRGVPQAPPPAAIKEAVPEIAKPVAPEPKPIRFKTKFTRLPNLELNGIIKGRGKPIALINDEVLNVGDSVEGAVITKIGEESVNLVYKNEEFILRIK